MHESRRGEPAGRQSEQASLVRPVQVLDRQQARSLAVAANKRVPSRRSTAWVRFWGAWRRRAAAPPRPRAGPEDRRAPPHRTARPAPCQPIPEVARRARCQGRRSEDRAGPRPAAAWGRARALRRNRAPRPSSSQSQARGRSPPPPRPAGTCRCRLPRAAPRFDLNPIAARIENSGDLSGLAVASDQRRGLAAGTLFAQAAHAPGRHRRVEAGDFDGADRLAVEGFGDGASGRPGDQRLAGLRQLAKPGRQVHGRPGHRVAAMQAAPARAGHHRSGGDPDMELGQSATRLGRGKAKTVQGVSAQSGALGIVVMGDRRAENRHEPVADMLVYAAAEADDLGVGAFEEAVQPGLHRLRIEAVGERGETDQIGEQHRGRPKLGLRRLGRGRRWPSWQGHAAAPAKSLSRQVRKTASRARRRQRGAATGAEATAFPVFGLAARTAH